MGCAPLAEGSVGKSASSVALYVWEAGALESPVRRVPAFRPQLPLSSPPRSLPSSTVGFVPLAYSPMIVFSSSFSVTSQAGLRP